MTTADGPAGLDPGDRSRREVSIEVPQANTNATAARTGFRWDERTLLLLGLLRAQSQHGYRINEFIERSLSRVTDMKKSTAYAILGRLHEAGLVSQRTEQEGHRPPRRVYAITPVGEEAFRGLLRAHLARPGRTHVQGDIALMFVDQLDRAEAVGCLERRLAELDARLSADQHHPEHRHGLGVELALERRQVLLRAERDWLRAVIERLS